MNKRIFDHIRDRLVSDICPSCCNYMHKLKTDNWSDHFEFLMRNRLIVGSLRYGPFNKQNRSTELVLNAIIKRAEQYKENGNDELLVDIANLCMKEFVTGNHPKKHFRAVDDGEHV